MQTLIFGLKVSALGMGIVFVVLAFLIGVIKVMAKLTEISDSKKKPNNPGAMKLGTVVQPTSIKVEDDSEVIAVIAAAAACMTQGTMRITTIRRIREEYVSTWSAAGRQETMNLRQL